MSYNNLQSDDPLRILVPGIEGNMLRFDLRVEEAKRLYDHLKAMFEPELPRIVPISGVTIRGDELVTSKLVGRNGLLPLRAPKKPDTTIL